SFIVLSYFLSWICWFPILDQINADVFSSLPHVIILLLLGGYSPSISALALSMLVGGKKGTGELLNKIKIMRVGLKWYVLCLLVGPVFLFIATGIYLYNGGEVGWVNYNVFIFLP